MLPRLFLIGILGFGIVLSTSVMPVHAQGVGEGINIDIEATLFPNTKKGCEMRSEFNFAMIKSFQNGDSPESIANFKMLESLVAKTFETIKSQGAAQAQINSINEYVSCVHGSKPVKDPEKELLLVSKHTACTKLAGVVLGTLESIQTREKLETIQARYANENIDFIDTGYENYSFQGQDMPDTQLKNPVGFFIGQIYDVSQSRSYDDAVAQGAGVVMGCFTGK